MLKFNKISVLGAGAFGVALAKLVSKKTKAVTLWGRDEQVCLNINTNRHHPHRLSQVTLPSNIFALTDLKSALKDAECVILALPMEALPLVLSRALAFIDEEAIIVSTAKGIEAGTLFLPCDVIKNLFTSALSERACYLSGPSFAIELAMELPTALTLASHDKNAAMLVQSAFSSPTCRLYRSDDVIGVCVGGALKNVIAIAAGACSALGLGKNALAALITRGLAEITRLAKCQGGKPITLSGLSGAGDLILSCTDDMSRNHRLGTLMADGQSLSDALITIGSVVEGSKTAKAVPDLEAKYGVDLPISRAVYRVLYDGVSARTAISSLLERSLKEEGL